MAIERVQRLLLGLGSVMIGFGVGAGCAADNAPSGTGTTPMMVPGPGMVQPTPTPTPPAPVTPSSSTVVPPTPTAGAGAVPPTPVAGSTAMPPVTPPVMPAPGQPLAMDECGIDTQYPGDEYCILPPPPDKGFQLHIGPDDYNNVDPRYILNAGGEITNTFTGQSTNTETRFFYYRQFRQRPGAHHNIITGSGAGVADMGHRIGTTNRLSEDSPQGGIIAPENTGVGIEIGPSTTISVSLHSINTTDGPVLREIWVNFWYVPAEDVTDPVEEMFQTGDIAYAIPPGADTIIGPNRCTFTGDGRMLWMYGHRHASNRRFSTWRVRGTQRDLIYESYYWEEPMVIEYSSTVMNAVPNRETKVEGGWSGILDIQAGDVLEWECHIVNEQNTTLRFSNETFAGEMCIVDAELVGTNCGFSFGG